MKNADSLLRVVSYEDRAEAMDGLRLMAESLCRIDSGISLHLTVPGAPTSLVAWAKGRADVVLTTTRPVGLSGWDVKPWLLLQELNAGRPQALWLDSDMIVTRPVSPLLEEFPANSLIVAEEWNRPPALRVTDLWGWPCARPVAPVNSCFVRVTQAHQALLERWIETARDPRYRKAQAIPFERRPFHLASDQALLTALLGTEEFGREPFDYIRMGRHIAQCAGSSGYRPLDRVIDLVRGLPPLIHCIGRKPWESGRSRSGAQQFLIDLSSDVSPYVLAARRAAKDTGVAPEWLRTRTSLGSVCRVLTACHPGMAGLPLAILHKLAFRFAQQPTVVQPKA